MEIAYLFCAVVGFLFTVVSAVLSGVFGGADASHDFHADGGADVPGHGGDVHVAPVGPTTIAMFVTAFGAAGLVAAQGFGLPFWAHLSVALGAGFLFAAVLFHVLHEVFEVTQGSSEARLDELVGLPAEVITPIPAAGVGEIAYVSRGARYTAPARAENGRPLPTHAPVVVRSVAGATFIVAAEEETGVRTLFPTRKEPRMTPLVLAQTAGWPVGVVVAAALVVTVLFLLLIVWANRYVKVGPNEVLIISGRRRVTLDAQGKPRTVGYRVTKGGGAFVIPILEKAQVLSLELMTLDVKPPAIYCATGAAVQVDGVAQIKVKGDDVSIGTAAEQFLSKTRAEIMDVALQTVEGHLRAIVGTLTIEEIYKNRELFAQRVQEVAATDLANMGLQIVSFTLRDIRDPQGYLDALGRPRIAQVKRDASIGEAEAARDSTIKGAQANQLGQEARFSADTLVAASSRDFEMKSAEYQAAVNQKKAESDLAYDLQKFKTGQLVKKEEVQVQLVEKESLIAVQEKEIERRRRELQATVEKPADAERYRIATLAEAERVKLETEASGRAAAVQRLGAGEAEAQKARGLAEAEVVRAQGLAQAEVLRAQGEAQAEAMLRKAEAWKAYNEAALAQMVIDKLPEIARAVAEPLSRIERMVVISADGNGGASRITGDVANAMAQLPVLVEALTGVDLKALVRGKTQKERKPGVEG
jgi:flotillin